MNNNKPHQDIYETADPELDFDILNDKYLPEDILKREFEQIYTIYKVKPAKTDAIETNEEHLNRLKAELFDLKEEVEFLAEKEKLFNGNADDEELSLLKEIQKLENEMMEIAKTKGVDSILSNSVNNQANFLKNLKFLEEQKQSKILEKIFSKIDVFLYLFFLSLLI